MKKISTLRLRYGHWAVMLMIGACAFAAACGEDETPEPGAVTEANATSPSGAPEGSESSGANEGADGVQNGTSGGPEPGTQPSPRTEGATEPNLKIAFIGDTASGNDFKSVLKLAKEEKVSAVFIQGDVTYGGDKAADWFPAIDNEINAKNPGSTATVTIPYFVAKGNHDTDWRNIGAGLKTRLGQWGIAPENNDPTTINYSVVFKGLKVVMVSDSETTPKRVDYVKQRLEGDKHLWKICSWHKNMRESNVGPKGNEMGWEIYENCRNAGAIVAQGHSHTYSRSKTLTNDTNQTVDPTCKDPFALCVGPGKHFFFDSSLGGHDMRPLANPYAQHQHWASTFNASFGALFIEFHVDGDPRKARGYFKTVGGTIIDPPASSGKTYFTLTSSN